MKNLCTSNYSCNYLRENGIIPEKCDLNSILFLLTPAETLTKMQTLVAQIAFCLKNTLNKTPLLKDVRQLCIKQ